jgi:hypothetical protein
MNKNLKIFCMSLYDDQYENLRLLNYIPVGLGNFSKFRDGWLRDNSGKNISHKNRYYGEYTFYYWFWQNKLKYIEDNLWVGFSHYRHHWSNQNKINSDELNKIINKENFYKYILKENKSEWDAYDVILGEPMYVNGKYKISKIIKKGLKVLFRDITAFTQKKRNIKLHFDIFHGNGLMDAAIEMLDDENRDDFRYFVNNEYCFNRENMFICKSKNLMNDYFKSIFSWLERCEKIFGFNLHGYAKIRIYTFLAERYISYWFNKNSKALSWPIFFYDTNKNKIQLNRLP